MPTEVTQHIMTPWHRRIRRLAAPVAVLVGLGWAVPSSAWATTTTTSATIKGDAVAVGTSAGTSTTDPSSTTTASTTSVASPDSSVVPRPGAIPLVSTQLNGAGSSFAAPAIENFTHSVGVAPYNLNVNYSSTSSGDGRYEFASQTTNFAVSDIAYGLGSTDTTPPSFPFIYVPITAGGIAFMYNIPGLTKTLQLSSYSACALLTGGITNWNDPAIAKDNPGVSLPNLTVRPVTESDSAGTNYVLEEWCLDEQPALWTAFANHENGQVGGPGDGVQISAKAPNSNWPGLPGGLDQQSTSGVAGNVATNPRAIGAVQLKYTTDLGFGSSTPDHGVASVLNASGDYTQPTPADVASALAYATQLDNGTHQLNFGGVGPHVYNPSTYSYLLSKTTGWDPSEGAVLSGFVNYALTLGQEASPSFGYASLGLSLEQSESRRSSLTCPVLWPSPRLNRRVTRAATSPRPRWPRARPLQRAASYWPRPPRPERTVGTQRDWVPPMVSAQRPAVQREQGRPVQVEPVLADPASTQQFPCRVGVAWRSPAGIRSLSSSWDHPCDQCMGGSPSSATSTANQERAVNRGIRRVISDRSAHVDRGRSDFRVTGTVEDERWCRH